MDPYPASANVLTDELVSDSSIKKDKHDISQSLAANESVEPRKRSHSFTHWMQKKVANVTSFHPRQRATTITFPSSPRSAIGSFPAFRDVKETERKRANTDPRMLPQKIILLDTDKRAQRKRSMLEFGFVH